jgi:hypothetical protein
MTTPEYCTMKRNPILVTTMTFVALICLGRLAPAASLTRPNTDPVSVAMVVPVQLSNFGGAKARVWCEIRDANGQGLAAAPMNTPAIVNGSLNTTVSFSVRVPQNSVALARGWRCILSADLTLGGGLAEPLSIPASVVPMAEVSGKF